MAPSTGRAASRPSMVVQLVAVALLAGGVGVGVASFLPAYLGGTSLAAQPDLAMAHAVTTAGFALAAVLAVAAGRPGAAGASLGLPGAFGVGVAAVDLGLVITDIGQAVSGTSAGAGLVLAVVEWALCAAGSALALHPVLLRPARRARAPRGRQDRVGGLVVVAAGMAAAGLFAPAWDRYVVDLAAVGRITTITAGNAFAEPGAMIAGSVVVMLAVAAVAVAGGFLRQARVAAALLAGAVVVLAGQIASALVQWRMPLSPAQFGLSEGRASALGLHVDAGFTAAFYLFCVFVALLAGLAAARASTALRPQATPAPAPAPASAAAPAPSPTGGLVPTTPPWGPPGPSAVPWMPPPAGPPVAPPGSYPAGYALAGYAAAPPTPPSVWEVHGWEAPGADPMPSWAPPVPAPAWDVLGEATEPAAPWPLAPPAPGPVPAEAPPSPVEAPSPAEAPRPRPRRTPHY